MLLPHFTADDVKNLGDNIVTILNTIKNLTQPDMLHAINNAVSVYKNIDVKVDEKVSFFSLLKEMNSPEVKRGLAVGLKFLKNLAAMEANQKQLNQNKYKINQLRSINGNCRISRKKIRIRC